MRNFMLFARPFWRNVRLSAVHTWEFDRSALIGRALFIVIEVASELLRIYFFAQVVEGLTDFLADGATDRSQIFIPLALTILFQGTLVLSYRFLGYYEKRIWWTWTEVSTTLLTQKMSELDIQRFEDKEYDKHLNKLVQRYGSSPANFVNYVFLLFHALLSLLGSAAIIMTLTPLLVPVIIISQIPSLIAQVKFTNIAYGIWNTKGDSSKLYWRTTHFLLDGQKLKETKIFGTKDFLVGNISRLLREFNDEQRSEYRRLLPSILGGRLVEVVVLGAIQIWLVLRVLARGTFGLGEFTLYTSTITKFANDTNGVFTSLGSIQDYNLYMTDFYDLLDVAPLLKQPEHPVKLPKETIPRIEFRNVSFAYPGTDKHILKNFSLTIEPGESVALVGKNGAGKTTIIKLLMRFYDVDEGCILIDGHDLRELDMNSWYRHVGVLFQDFNDYPYSVRDNIALGRLNRFGDDDGVVAAAKTAGAHEFISKYDLGYEQRLDPSFEDGIRPSGGQWQRVALARAFFRNAGVLVLDEPTAAVDAAAEYEIFKNIEANYADKTTIIISHRFSTVRKADTIYVIDDGRIIESGSHRQLMHKRGVYHDLFSKQAEGYK